jgi:hypothetical protein
VIHIVGMSIDSRLFYRSPTYRPPDSNHVTHFVEIGHGIARGWS